MNSYSTNETDVSSSRNLILMKIVKIIGIFFVFYYLGTFSIILIIKPSLIYDQIIFFIYSIFLPVIWIAVSIVVEVLFFKFVSNKTGSDLENSIKSAIRGSIIISILLFLLSLFLYFDTNSLAIIFYLRMYGFLQPYTPILSILMFLGALILSYFIKKI